MAVRKILRMGDPRLLEPAAPVEAFATPELRAKYRKECLGMGADFVELDTSMRFDHALVKYLSGRKARF